MTIYLAGEELLYICFEWLLPWITEYPTKRPKPKCIVRLALLHNWTIQEIVLQDDAAFLMAYYIKWSPNYEV